MVRVHDAATPLGGHLEACRRPAHGQRSTLRILSSPAASDRGPPSVRCRWSESSPRQRHSLLDRARRLIVSFSASSSRREAAATGQSRSSQATYSSVLAIPSCVPSLDPARSVALRLLVLLLGQMARHVADLVIAPALRRRIGPENRINRRAQGEDPVDDEQPPPGIEDPRHEVFQKALTMVASAARTRLVLVSVHPHGAADMVRPELNPIDPYVQDVQIRTIAFGQHLPNLFLGRHRFPRDTAFGDPDGLRQDTFATSGPNAIDQVFEHPVGEPGLLHRMVGGDLDFSGLFWLRGSCGSAGASRRGAAAP